MKRREYVLRDFPLLMAREKALLRMVSGVSGMLSGSDAPAIMSESRLVKESLYDEEYVRWLYGVTFTKLRKYFSCSMLEPDVCSPLVGANQKN